MRLKDLIKQLQLKYLAAILLILNTERIEAKNTSIQVDITQLSLFNPIVVFNFYNESDIRKKFNFWQFGLGVAIKANNSYYHSYTFESDKNNDHYHDDIGLASYNGAQARVGYFIGKKMKRNVGKLIKMNRNVYLGIGSNFKILKTKNMSVKYEPDSSYPDPYSNDYRIQDEKVIVISPFFNTGIISNRNKLYVEWYGGIEAVIKIRDKTIVKEVKFNCFTNSYVVTGPYKQSETIILPSLVFGFRVGLFLNKFD